VEKRSRFSLGFLIERINIEDIPVSAIVRLACALCSGWGSCYHCPPHSPEIDQVCKIFRKYRQAYLVVAYYDIGRLVQRHLSNGRDPVTSILLSTKTIDNVSWWDFNKLLQSLSRSLSKVRVLGSGGGCRLCRPCRLHLGKPCAHPDKSFPSPESWGILVYALLDRYSILFQNPPRTIMVRVGLIFTDEVLQERDEVDWDSVRRLEKTRIELETNTNNSELIVRKYCNDTISISLDKCGNCRLEVSKICKQLLKTYMKLRDEIERGLVKLDLYELRDDNVNRRAVSKIAREIAYRYVREGIAYVALPLTYKPTIARRVKKYSCGVIVKREYLETLCMRVLGGESPEIFGILYVNVVK